ncbi:MAG: IS66-like element accessory protein TnpA [Betaproteobacteria bacterium]
MEAQRGGGRHRRHSAEFKRQVLAECAAPGARIAEVAAAHGLPPSLIYYWRRCAAESALRAGAAPTAAVAQFVPVTVTDGPSATIRIELRRGATVAQVHWPLTAAGACAEWLRGWLR